jgi:acetyl-CoA carboxylase carboxyl transferase subunit alpha
MPMSDERTLDLLEAKIAELRELNKLDGMNLAAEIEKLERKLESLRIEHYAELSDWDRVKLARHAKRPTSLEIISHLCDSFFEMHGDRLAGDDAALIGGLARFDGRSIVVLAHQKGRSTEENKERLFGMARPQGYRKAMRLMRLAERFEFPVLSLIDTPGAYPGLESESLNIGGAIAENLETMMTLEVPTLAVVIGEGGSGGALAIGAADRVLMLENAIYTVISPEGAAAVLWKDKERARDAAQALALTAPRLAELELVDEVIPEPLGGAHKGVEKTCASLRDALLRHLAELDEHSIDERRASRYQRYRSIGRFHTLPDVA